jgi:hypothetical protein
MRVAHRFIGGNGKSNPPLNVPEGRLTPLLIFGYSGRPSGTRGVATSVPTNELVGYDHPSLRDEMLSLMCMG